jgi:carboxyl-terminal processing protease
MRKNSLFFLGTAAGVCLTLLVSGPQGAHVIAAAGAAANSGAYAQLNLFGEVFERVKSD